MVQDMCYNIEIIGCPIIREPDGLAKSSRNTYLNSAERKAALCLSRAVFLGKDLVKSGETNAAEIEKAMTEEISKEPLARIDYVQVVNGTTMMPADRIDGNNLVAVAVYIGKTRLIDNFIVEGDLIQ